MIPNEIIPVQQEILKSRARETFWKSSQILDYIQNQKTHFYLKFCINIIDGENIYKNFIRSNCQNGYLQKEKILDCCVLIQYNEFDSENISLRFHSLLQGMSY